MNPYAAGAKVYNGASSTATSGTVNPMGYIERGLNQQASQKRSGLAQAALTALGRGGTPPMGNTGVNGTGPGTQNRTTTGPISPAGATPQRQPNYANGYDYSKDPTGKINGPFDAASDKSNLGVTQQKLGSDWTGKLSFGLDQDLLAERVNAQEVFGDNQAKLNQQGFNLNRDYHLNRDKIAKAANSALMGMKHNFAGRGMYNSTGFTQNMDLTTNEFGTQMSDLSRQRADAFQTLNQTGMDNLRALQQAIRSAIGGQTTRNAARARNS